MFHPSPTHFRARWILPVEGSPIRDGTLTVRDGRLVQIGKAATPETAVDFGEAAIIPALVNAHTHLEFSNLERPLGESGSPFTEWIKQVIAWRRKRDAVVDATVHVSPSLAPAIRLGIEESLRAGVVTLGEIATSLASATELEQSLGSGVVFWEVIGWSPANVASNLHTAQSFPDGQSQRHSKIVGGVSPHAPYTVHQDLLRAIVKSSAANRFPIAMHLAETEAELQLLADGTGPLADMLYELNAWERTAILFHSRPLDYLRILAEADRALVIHGNYLDEAEVRFLGEHRAKMSVVYCPRTHRYFGHRRHPVEKLLDAGARVALGTDSRASNPDLSLWNEMLFAGAEHPGIAPETWLQIATLEGAAALGLEKEYGSLRPGKVANFLVIPLAPGQVNGPWSWFGDVRSEVSQVYVRGERWRSP